MQGPQNSQLCMIDLLKKGLHILRNQVQERKSRIKSDQKAGTVFSESDEDWLDGEGNLVNEERVVQDLEEASDYERGLGRLDAEGRGIVQRLQVLGGGQRWPLPCIWISDSPSSSPC